MVRLKDIAQRAGTSVMTVSKALRDAPDISAGTKARLRLLAQQMGYVPDSQAQSLRTRRTKLLGIVLSASTNPVVARFQMAVEEQAFALGYELIIAHSLNDPAREEAVIRRLLSRRVDGLMIHPVYQLATEVPVYQELRQCGLPTVILDSVPPFCRDFVFVGADDLQASQVAAQHLLGLGHRRIAFFTGPVAAPWAQDRLEGFRRALREVQLPVDDHLLFQAGTTIEGGEKAALQMLAESPSATAILAANDLAAIGAGNVLLDRGVRIPEDLSLVGSGDFLPAQFFRVPLTTLRQPKWRLGEAATASLVQLIQGEHPESIRLPAELIIRRSTAPPPSAAPAPAI